MPVVATAAMLDTTTNSELLQSVVMSRRFLEMLKANLVVLPLGTREDIPTSSGVTLRWRFMNTPSAVTGALTEGTDSTDSHALTANVATGTLATFGAFFELSDLFELSAVSGTVQAFVEASSFQAAITLDTLCQTLALASATNTNDVGTAMKAEDVRFAVSELEGNDAQRHPATPGGQFFCGVFSVEAAYDMLGEGAPSWMQVKTDDLRSSFTTPMLGTVATAAVYGCLIKTSTNVQATGGDDVNYIIAKDAFGVCGIDSDLLNPSVMIVPAVASNASPLAMRSTIGWKVHFDAVLIDANRVVELLSDQT